MKGLAVNYGLTVEFLFPREKQIWNRLIFFFLQGWLSRLCTYKHQISRDSPVLMFFLMLLSFVFKKKDLERCFIISHTGVIQTLFGHREFNRSLRW